eukprot:2892354-Pleurochrysis_carterae.AAC.1
MQPHVNRNGATFRAATEAAVRPAVSQDVQKCLGGLQCRPAKRIPGGSHDLQSERPSNAHAMYPKVTYRATSLHRKPKR